MAGERIVVCDDEAELRETLVDFLQSRGYEVSSANNGEALQRVLAASDVDLVILDVRMPRMDGISALKAIRRDSDLPIIMLTAADETVDRILGLELGADDYVGKPVDPRELEARVRTVLRRRVPQAAGPAIERKGSLSFSGYRLDLDGARLTDPDGQEIALTAMEFALLQVFAENPTVVLSRDQLLDTTHDRDWEPFDRSIDLRISRLRRKLEPGAGGKSLIRTVRGIGYVFDPG